MHFEQRYRVMSAKTAVVKVEIEEEKERLLFNINITIFV